MTRGMREHIVLDVFVHVDRALDLALEVQSVKFEMALSKLKIEMQPFQIHIDL